MSKIVARYNQSSSASISATLRTADAPKGVTYTSERDPATGTFVVVEHTTEIPGGSE